jgi:hypothetical protein
LPKPLAKRRMYRGILTAQAICDCFVRAISDEEATALIERGKGQKAKPRFGKWDLWRHAVGVEGYTASDAIPSVAQGLTEQELGKIYIEVLRNISVLHRAFRTDSERQAMADAVHDPCRIASGE